MIFHWVFGDFWMKMCHFCQFWRQLVNWRYRHGVILISCWGKSFITSIFQPWCSINWSALKLSKPWIFNLFQTDSKFVNFNKTNQDYDFRILLFKISWYKPTLYSPKKRLLNRSKLESGREMRKLRNQKFEFSREINLKIAHRWYRTPRSDLSQNHPQFLIKSSDVRFHWQT